MDNYGISKVNITVPEGEQISSIPVGYRISDTRKNEVTLLPKYSTDNGITWNDATTEGIISGLGASKYIGEFVWLAQIDLDGYEGTVLFQVTPRSEKEGISDSRELNVDFNDIPVLTVVPVAEEVSGDVPVYYSVSDSESDLVSIAVLYSVDDRANWDTASVSGDISGVSGDGSSHTVVWNSVNDVPGQDIKNVWLHLTVSDYDTGETVETGPFRLDNNNPPSVTLNIDYPDSTFEDVIDINYELTDDESDTLSFAVLYSVNGGTVFNQATISGNTTNILPANYNSSIRWEIAEDLPGYFGSPIITIIPSDSDTGYPDSLTIAVNSYGFCSVTTHIYDIKDSTMTFEYEITDVKEHLIQLQVEYSQDAGKSWYIAYLDTSLTDISPENYHGYFNWYMRSDLNGYDGDVRIRITPDNGVEGGASTHDIQVDFNEVPSLTLLTAFQDSVYSGPVSMTVQASDTESDMVTPLLEYSTDGGITYNHATLADSSSFATGIATELVWLTLNDLRFVRNAPVILRITPKDNDPGESVITEPVTVTNIVGDYTFDFAIDGEDLPAFIDAWNHQTIYNETGPATGTAPYFTVKPDGIIDFEDLAVFTMMWNWYSEHGTVDIVTKFVAETNESDPLIRLVQNQTGVISVMCDEPVDYMDLYIETGSGERSVFTLTESDYWAVDNNGFVLSRSHGTNRAELASGIFSAESRPQRGPTHWRTSRLTKHLRKMMS